MNVRADAWVLEKAGQPLARKSIELSPGEMDVVVEVEACGLCHTDLGFADGSVAPRHALPLVLGHEIAGVVTSSGAARGSDLVGKRVLVPAVMSCGDCAFCRAGRGNACLRQTMPGNDANGGFATHLVAPAASLVVLDGAPATMRTDALGVVADAVSTAYQAARRAWLDTGDVAFVIGGGGVGGFAAQIARALGAHVLVCDVDATRLERLSALGIETVNVGGRDPKDVRKQLHARAKEWGVPSIAWRIFECSGTTSGQLLAYALLSNASTVVFVGYTREMVSVRLSNLMAFDATAHGSWGCPRERYPDVLDLIYRGAVVLEPFIERAPMSRINEHLSALAEHRLDRRLVLDPRT
jgi:6-hydroxycyclohex-1-ene-1-carbonyl-CoA dehydrogenase